MVWSRSRDLGLIPTLVTHVVVFLDKAIYDDYHYLLGFKQAAN